jgi:hypothetical protein
LQLIIIIIIIIVIIVGNVRAEILVDSRGFWFSFLCTRGDYPTDNDSITVSDNDVKKLFSLLKLREITGMRIGLLASSAIRECILIRLIRNLMFMCPCITSVIIMTTNKMQLFLIYLFLGCCTCFGRFLRPSSGAYNCTYSFGYFQPNCC